MPWITITARVIFGLATWREKLRKYQKLNSPTANASLHVESAVTQGSCAELDPGKIVNVTTSANRNVLISPLSAGRWVLVVIVLWNSRTALPGVVLLVFEGGIDSISRRLLAPLARE